MTREAVLGEISSDMISACLYGNKTLHLMAGWKPMHVAYSSLNNANGGTTDDVIMRNISTVFTSDDVYHDREVQECRLQVTSAIPQALLHVKLVGQICTRANKIVFLENYGNDSTTTSVLPSKPKYISLQPVTFSSGLI